MSEEQPFVGAVLGELFRGGDQGPVIAALGALAAVLALVLLVLALLRRRHAFGFSLLALVAAAPPLVFDAVRTARELPVQLDEQSPDVMLMGLLGELEMARALALAGTLVPVLVACLLVGLGLSRLPRVQAPD